MYVRLIACSMLEEIDGERRNRFAENEAPESIYLLLMAQNNFGESTPSQSKQQKKSCVWNSMRWASWEDIIVIVKFIQSIFFLSSREELSRWGAFPFWEWRVRLFVCLNGQKSRQNEWHNIANGISCNEIENERKKTQNNENRLMTAKQR